MRLATRMLRWTAWSVLAVVLLAAATLSGLRLAGMPKADGVLEIPGPSAEFRILRDDAGIPHVFAAAERDAWFAIGLLHAQDRLWQMEMNRRIVRGRLAEILGPSALDTDRFLRTLGVHRHAERVLAGLDEATRDALQAYADGVNAGIGLALDAPWKLSPEFLLVGARPEPWTPADSIGWSTMMAWDLSANHASELLRFALSERLSTERLADLMDTDPPLRTLDFAKLYDGISRAEVAGLLRALPPGNIDGIGSNNWVVDGRHTATGKPLLANDPHLGLKSPALWYLAHLSAPGLDVVGATLPGMPMVILGRNARIAWGFTNTGPDTQDLYLEQVDPADRLRYRTPDGWAAFQTRTEVIRVNGAPDVTVEVRETRHGPVISDVHAQAAATIKSRRLGERYVLAFQWAALKSDDATVRAAFGVNRASDWASFVAAVRETGAPQQNMVYADVDGNVGYVAPGRIPIRRPDNDLHGLAPAPGWDARYDWTGWVPVDSLPRTFAPADGVLVTANQKVVPPDAPYFLGAEWTLPFRFDRIRDRLSAVDRHDVESFSGIQSDKLSPAVAELLPFLRQARAASEAGGAALERLRHWRGEMRADAPEPLIATAWIDRLRRLVFEDEAGAELFPLLERQRVRHTALVRAVTTPAQAGWCDDVRTEAVERCDQLRDRALEEAIRDLQRRYGRDQSRWRWGDAHVAVSEHRPFSKVPYLARVFEVRVPSGGDTHTIDVGRHNPWETGEPFANRWAASLRAVYDLSEPDGTRLIHATGQSGHVLSPHYRDMAERWARGESLVVPLGRERVEQAARSTLVVRPRG